jgi:hypothetical protein
MPGAVTKLTALELHLALTRPHLPPSRRAELRMSHEEVPQLLAEACCGAPCPGRRHERGNNDIVAVPDFPPPDEMDEAVLRAVRAALDERPEGSATLTQRWEDGGGWAVEVQPRLPTAAPFSVVFTDGDILSVAVGHIWFEIFPVRSIDELDYLREIAAAVLAGRVEESRYKDKAWGRIQLDQGPVGIGIAHLPWPWRAKPKKHTYDAYQ